MASTYSPLKIELIGTGEQAGIWGTTTNINLGTALEEAITGSADVSFSGADVTLTLTDTNASQAGRNLRLNLTGASGGARNLILGSGMQIEKLYLINNGLADAVTVKNTTGTGVAVPAGRSMFVFNNGTNVVDAITHLNSPSLTTPRVITSINDTNGNELFGVTATGSAVNEFTVANAATGNAPTLSATGGDTNIGMALTPKGTGGVIFPAGAVGTPAITTTGDTNTGIFFPAADQVAIATNGVERANLGNSATVFNETGADVDFRVEGDTNANLLFVDAGNDRVGIGTSTPAARFTVVNTSAGNLVTALRLSNDSSTAGSGSRIEFHTTDAVFNAIDGVRPNVSSGGQLLFSTMSTGGTLTERMIIDSSGNVGIGTTSPGTKLDVNGTIRANNTISYESGTIRNVMSAAADGGVLGTTSNHATIFFANNAERARITSGGYFKASDNGTYVDSAGNFHEIRQTINNNGLILSNTNASFTNDSLQQRITKSAGSDFNFQTMLSGGTADVEFLLRGDGNAFADGTWSNNGADYAEFFESVNGEALTLGATVVLDGNKVREATEQDPTSAVIGVVRPKEPSKASMIIGNTAWNKWANKYLSDDFDRYIMEDHDVVEWEEQVLEKEATEAVEAVVDEEGNEVSPAIPAQEAVYKTKSHSYESHNIPEGITVPADATIKTHDDKGNKFQHYKLNPAWDKDAEYVNRENRPEWNIIGLVGQVKVLKGQPTNDRWIKMRDVSATVEEWFIR